MVDIYSCIFITFSVRFSISVIPNVYLHGTELLSYLSFFLDIVVYSITALNRYQNRGVC